jgi:flagellar biosynthesis protein FlhF
VSALAAQTYRGSSLDELLPQIRAELGADAIILRRREGIVGGVGGFFGKKCVEVDALPAAPPHAVAMPARAVVEAYDSPEPAPLLDENPLLEALLAQTSPFSEPTFADPPFAQQLAEALEIAAEPEPEPEPAFAPAVRATDDRGAVLDALATAGVPAGLADEIVDEVDYALRPFEPATPFRELARRALARRIPVAHGWRTSKRTIAVLGLPGAGRTATAARLCAAYGATGRTVGALGLEDARQSLRLAELVQGLDVQLAFADGRDLVARAKRTLGDCDVVVVDTPPIANRLDGPALRRTIALVTAARPAETHLLLPADADPVLARRFVGTVTRALKTTRLLLTNCDAAGARAGIGVGLSLSTGTPISFLAAADALKSAEPETLARMVLP